ncbi:MAG: pyridoxal phosphate enzyme (YggS family) [Candidatus Promineifilaceae bacterium]|jgi:PLP dependent protein
MAENEEENLLSERVDVVRERIAQACARSGRDVDTVGLIAVSKKFPADIVHDVHRCGVNVFGESRVQEALQKIPDCPGMIDWHFIGRLQSNKVRPVVSTFCMIHSVDSLALLERVEAIAYDEGPRVDVCLQVNVAGEGSKTGVPPDQAEAIVERAQAFNNARLVGLMTMPPFAPDPEDVRPHFAALRALRDTVEQRCGVSLPDLSMGMSHDFEVAIEEGATWIRVGSAIFGKRVVPRHAE